MVPSAIGLIKCKAAASQRVWTNTSQKFAIQDHKTLTLSSIMVCPAEGGTITAKETVWEAWGSAALTNLGHVANFAFGFLAGRGAVGMVGGAAGATSAAGATGLRQTVTTFGREFGRQFANTARKELIEQFTFKGFKNASLFCKTMRGLGIGGAYYDQYSIWSSDKDVLEKLKDSGVSLVLGIFAAKGATLVCFPAGTKVHTPNGMQNIEDLYEDDLVLTYNETTKQQEYKPILTKHERFTQQMLSLELPTGEFVRVTPEHRFFCNDEWIEAGSLKAGDLLHLKGGDYTTVISIEVLPHYEKVYNFDIEDNENYYVTEDGILVHNGRYRAIDKAQQYEDDIQDLYGGAANFNSRQYTAIVDGQLVNGVADNVAVINGKNVAIEAKFVEDWNKSLRNPLDTKPWAIAEQNKMLDQAKKYSNAFDEVIYHTNSQELADHYSQVFSQNGITNVRFEITP